MPIQADQLIHLLTGYRLLHVEGRYGGGKTSVAVRLAAELVNRGIVKHIVTNFPCVLATEHKDGLEPKDVVVVMDEGGVFLAGKMVDDFIAYLRKFNVIIIMPSVTDVDAKVRAITMQRTFDWTKLGLPWWRYQCTLRSGRIQEKFGVNFFMPSEVFGLYDTKGVIADDDCIVEWLLRAVDDSLENQGKKRRFKTERGVLGGEFQVGNGDASVDEIRRASVNFSQAADAISESLSVANSQGRRRRR